MRRIKPFLFVVYVIASLAILVEGICIYYRYSTDTLPTQVETAASYETANEKPTSTFTVKASKQPKNILLIGSDSRGEDGKDYGQRSDSMILASIQPSNNRIALVSSMRDMYVSIPAYGMNRLNTAYSFGGVELLEETLMKNFDVGFDNYVVIDFDGFIKSIASVGGLEIELTEEEAAYMNKHPEYGWTSETWDLQPGLNTLTGEQVLCYSRIRHVGNADWERTDRQRLVLEKLFQKMKEMPLWKQVPVANELRKNIETDASYADLLSLAKSVLSQDGISMESYRLPLDGTYTIETIDEMSVLNVDPDANAKYLDDILTGAVLEDEAEMPSESGSQS